MIVYKKSNNEVSKIEFCCGRMAKKLLLENVYTRPWTDHPLVFMLNNEYIDYCPWCGTKIDGERKED